MSEYHTNDIFQPSCRNCHVTQHLQDETAKETQIVVIPTTQRGQVRQVITFAGSCTHCLQGPAKVLASARCNLYPTISRSHVGCIKRRLSNTLLSLSSFGNSIWKCNPILGQRLITCDQNKMLTGKLVPKSENLKLCGIRAPSPVRTGIVTVKESHI